MCLTFEKWCTKHRQKLAGDKNVYADEYCKELRSVGNLFTASISHTGVTPVCPFVGDTLQGYVYNPSNKKFVLELTNLLTNEKAGTMWDIARYLDLTII